MDANDYADVLVPELAGDPLGRGYAGMSNREAAESLNAADRRVADHGRKTLRDLLRLYGMERAGVIHAKLTRAAESNRGVALAMAAAGDYSEGGGLDFADANTVAALATLVGSNVLTASEGVALKALGQKTVSRAAELGLGQVAEGHVHSARLRMGA